jgi:hypothetical protein
MAFIRFEETGLAEIIEYVQDIAGPPSFRTIGALERVHAGAFASTQVRVHAPGNPGSPTYVPTGSLRSSGTTDVETTPARWEGTISYGGSSHGFPNDPVDYAIYEMARGGLHDFFGELPTFFEAYLEAVAQHFEPRRG